MASRLPTPGDRRGSRGQLGRRRHAARRATRGDGRARGAQILDLIDRLEASGRVSIVIELHNYAQVFEACNRVNLIQEGTIALDKPRSKISVEEVTEIVVDQYHRARRDNTA